MSVDSEGCSRAGMDVDDHGKFSIVVVGETGMGKSQFCEAVANVASQTGKFHPSSSVDAHTIEVESCELSAFGLRFRLFDTPGLNDTGDRDAQHIAEMIRKLRTLSDVGLILVCLNATNPRLNRAVVETVRHFFDIFGHGMVANLAFLWTRCGPRRARELKGSLKVESFVRKLLDEAAVKGARFENISSFFVNSVDDQDLSYSEQDLQDEIRRILLLANANKKFDLRQAIATMERAQEIEAELTVARKELEAKSVMLAEKEQKTIKMQEEFQRQQEKERQISEQKLQELNIAHGERARKEKEERDKAEQESRENSKKELDLERETAEKKLQEQKREHDERVKKNQEEREKAERVMQENKEKELREQKSQFDSRFRKYHEEREKAEMSRRQQDMERERKKDEDMKAREKKHDDDMEDLRNQMEKLKMDKGKQPDDQKMPPGRIFYITPNGDKMHIRKLCRDAEIEITEREGLRQEYGYCKICCKGKNLRRSLTRKPTSPEESESESESEGD